MAVWMELRCERRGVSDTDCWSNQNSGPMLMSGEDTQVSVARAARELFADAAAGKWKRTREGWICPACATAPALSVKES